MANYGDSGYGFGGYGGGSLQPVAMGTGPIVTLPVSYYQDLLTSEYQGSTNLLAWLGVLCGVLGDIAQCLAVMPNAFDLDAAEGVQLDTLGVLIGQGRTVAFQPSNSISPMLDDTTYRLLLRARIAQNQWDGTIDGLQATWTTLFPDGRITIIDHQDMTASIILSGTFNSIISDLITNGYIVPRPEGVLYNISTPTLPMFGFDAENSYIDGLDAGHWS